MTTVYGSQTTPDHQVLSGQLAHHLAPVWMCPVSFANWGYISKTFEPFIHPGTWWHSLLHTCISGLTGRDKFLLLRPGMVNICRFFIFEEQLSNCFNVQARQTTNRSSALSPHCSSQLRRVNNEAHNSCKVGMENNNTYTNSTSGFRRGWSSIGNIVSLVICNYCRTPKTPPVHHNSFFLDVKEAFGCIEHQAILNALFEIGINAHLFDWTRNYPG